MYHIIQNTLVANDKPLIIQYTSHVLVIAKNPHCRAALSGSLNVVPPTRNGQSQSPPRIQALSKSGVARRCDSGSTCALAVVLGVFSPRYP